jgi:hypothetical protein
MENSAITENILAQWSFPRSACFSVGEEKTKIKGATICGDSRPRLSSRAQLDSF